MLRFLFICLGLFITSIFFLPCAPVSFEIPKVMFFHWFVRVLVLVFAFSFFLKNKKRINWKINRSIFIPVLLFVLWATFTSIVGIDVAKSFAGNYYRKDGLITIYELIGFSYLLSYFWKDKYKEILSLTLFSSSSFLSLIAITQVILGKFSLGSAATFGNPVFLAGYLSVNIPFGFYLYKLSGKKLYLLGLIIQFLAILLIGAISSILTLILFMVLYVLFFQKRLFKIIFLALLGVTFSLLIFFWFKNYQKESSRVFIAEGRERIFRNILIGIKERPFLGYGWANVDYAFGVGDWPIKFNDDVYVDKAHSNLLEILTTTGIIGLLIYLVFIFQLLKGIIFRYKKFKDKFWSFSLMAVLILYLFHSQTNVTSIMEEIIFWIILGVIL